MRYISTPYLDQLETLMQTAPYGIDLVEFRSNTHQAEKTDNRVLFSANDGNDYAIVETANEKYVFIGLTNSKDDKVGDLIAFSKHDSYREALAEMANMSATDLDM